VITLVLHLLRLLPFLVGGHRQLALENLALRQQLAVYKRMAPRPRLRTIDRLLWVGLARVWTGWLSFAKTLSGAKSLICKV
jgi:putative transposase